MSNTTLKISISPRDLRLLKYMLPHQLRFWSPMVDQILIVFDLHGYNSKREQSLIHEIRLLVKELSNEYPKIDLLDVDYSQAAKAQIAEAFFAGRRVPAKTHRYGPYYSYFFGLYHSKYDYVLNIDCDMFFGGHNPCWIQEAIDVLKKQSNVVSCSPLPGAPREDGKLIRQNGVIDNSRLRKIEFDSFSSRIFFLHKPSFRQNLCPIPVRVASLSLAFRAFVRNRPIFELPEDTITDIMREKKLKRVDFLGSHQGIWSIHPPYRNEEFYSKLPVIIESIEKDKVPLEQRGDYDINSSMINWNDAKEEIRKASLKYRVLHKLGLR